MSTPLEVCEERDQKGIYEKARRGEIKNFTGIDDPYELPSAADLTVNAARESVEVSAKKVLKFLQKRNLLS
jgi:adenylylsulfate kinase-like enzyme